MLSQFQNKEHDYEIKITGAAAIPVPIDDEHELALSGTVSVYAITKKPNHDGSYKYTFKCKFVSEIEIEQGDVVFRGRDKTKKSQKLRQALYVIHSNMGIEDTEDSYERVMNYLLYHAEEISEAALETK